MNGWAGGILILPLCSTMGDNNNETENKGYNAHGCENSEKFVVTGVIYRMMHRGKLVQYHAVENKYF